MTARLVLIAAALCALAAPAQAEWIEASSDHFVIYADDSEKDIRQFAVNLERYHSALEYLLGRKLDKPSPSNRVVIFVVGTQGEVRELVGARGANVAGFYIPRAGASRAFVQTIRNKDGYPDFSTTVLLHEYAHHFLISTSHFEMPRWIGEGMAEFFAAAGFPDNGGVLIGRPAQHRAAEIGSFSRFDLEGLLSHGTFDQESDSAGDAFYGRSWMLYHYLQFNPERQAQLPAYMTAVVRGATSLDAGRQAFGDFRQLERELLAYRRQRRFAMLEIPPEQLAIGTIALRRLPEGEAKVMPLRIRSQRGVNRPQALELVEEVRKVAARYPDDPGVLTALAEAEHDAGHDDAAIAAADRAIARDPARVNAYVQKGFALFRQAEAAPEAERDAAFARAMEPFTALNAREPDHPLPLVHYYRSYAQRGVAPPENARLALERAAQLAPFDKQLWFEVATLQMREGKIALAKQSLQPLAFDPHGGDRAEQMRGLLEVLGTLPEGEPVSRDALRVAMGGRAHAEAGSEGAPSGSD